MRIREKYMLYLGASYRYIKKIVDTAILQKKKIIMWGYGKGGVYARHIIKDIDARIDIECFIDDFLFVPYAPETKIYRSSILDYIDVNDFILLSSIKNSSEIEGRVIDAGFVENINYFNIREIVKGSNIEFIESTVRGTDFSYVTKEDRPDLYNGLNYESKPFDHSTIDTVLERLVTLHGQCEPALFDYGCGKGQILLSAYMSGIEKLAGIELNKDIYDIAVNNMKLLKVPCKIECGDAAVYKDIDDYNIFFFYNPFGGSVFQQVLLNIEESVKKKERQVFIVYGNPFYHKTVIESGFFHLYEQIHVDLYDPLLNIYSN